jgi:hypothetical protein
MVYLKKVGSLLLGCAQGVFICFYGLLIFPFWLICYITVDSEAFERLAYAFHQWKVRRTSKKPSP